MAEATSGGLLIQNTSWSRCVELNFDFCKCVMSAQTWAPSFIWTLIWCRAQAQGQTQRWKRTFLITDRQRRDNRFERHITGVYDSTGGYCQRGGRKRWGTGHTECWKQHNCLKTSPRIYNLNYYNATRRTYKRQVPFQKVFGPLCPQLLSTDGTPGSYYSYNCNGFLVFCQHTWRRTESRFTIATSVRYTHESLLPLAGPLTECSLYLPI